jgi:hypothetical protein
MLWGEFNRPKVRLLGVFISLWVNS